uniref:Uncharacterized protein n=1 Tax=Plectus sambesii TaxID=2011161 RepID=A0A914XLW8_9BILA
MALGRRQERLQPVGLPAEMFESVNNELISEFEAQAGQYDNISDVYETRKFDPNYKNHFSGHVLYCTGDDNKTPAGTGFYILASLAFIRLYTLNYTGNDGTGNDDFHQTTHVHVNG